MKWISFFIVILISIASVADTKSTGKRDPSSVSTNGNVEFILNGEHSWLRITGEAAMSVFDTMEGVAVADNEGAGNTVFFKYGTSYRCFADAVDTNNPSPNSLKDHVCDIHVIDPTKGLIDNNYKTRYAEKK